MIPQNALGSPRRSTFKELKIPVSKSNKSTKIPPNTAHERKCGKKVTVCTVFLKRSLKSSAVSTAKMIGQGKFMRSCNIFSPNVLNMIFPKSGLEKNSLKLSSPLHDP